MKWHKMKNGSKEVESRAVGEVHKYLNYSKLESREYLTNLDSQQRGPRFLRPCYPTTQLHLGSGHEMLQKAELPFCLRTVDRDRSQATSGHYRGLSLKNI